MRRAGSVRDAERAPGCPYGDGRKRPAMGHMMHLDWRTVTGMLAGIAAVEIWAVSAALHQPFMEPDGFWADLTTGQLHPNLASNNIYWPREIRHFAILLAVGGAILIGRATAHGAAVGAVAVAGWLGIDLWLDRSDVAGRTAVIWSAVCAVVAGVLALGVLAVTTPWVEPVVQPGQIRVENALRVIQVAWRGRSAPSRSLS
jgi:hypothetical protein